MLLLCYKMQMRRIYIIKAKSDEKAWGVDLGGLARIWNVGRR
jgi:hypothetical protein